jgi:hypothetical protein
MHQEKNVEDISREITLKLGLWIRIINAIREEGTVNNIQVGQGRIKATRIGACFMKLG